VIRYLWNPGKCFAVRRTCTTKAPAITTAMSNTGAAAAAAQKYPTGTRICLLSMGLAIPAAAVEVLLVVSTWATGLPTMSATRSASAAENPLPTTQPNRANAGTARPRHAGSVSIGSRSWFRFVSRWRAFRLDQDWAAVSAARPITRQLWDQNAVVIVVVSQGRVDGGVLRP
jgi:hypothetical protein